MFLAIRYQPTRGRLSSEAPESRATACVITFGLDALTACHMGVMTPLNAASKPPGSKAAHRHALRATNPFKTRVSPVFSFPRELGAKNGNAALKGLVAPDRQYSPLGREILPGLTVCGAGPHKNRHVGVPFCSPGRQNFCGSPGLLNSLRANVRRWSRYLKINNFCEIEFSVHAPLANFTA